MEELYNKLEEINNKSKEIDKKIYEMHKKNNLTNKKEFSLLIDEYKKLIKERKKIEEEIYFTSPPIKTNGVIDLRTADYNFNENETVYSIYLHNTKIEVGHITYRRYHYDEYFGDMGGYIEEEQRGNKYLYQALVLFSEKLYEEGVPDIWLSVNDNNLPSLKSIQKLNPKIIKQQYGTILFECETRKREDNLTPIKK